MSQNIQKKHTGTRPVSEKAYNGFVDRINAVIHDPEGRVLMLDALEHYLAGDATYYAESLHGGMLMAFEMLIFEIDRAMERSARARRRRQRRVAEPAGGAVSTKDLLSSAKTFEEVFVALHNALPSAFDKESDVEPEEPQTFVPPASRRSRRAKALSGRKKNRWQRIG